jgi:Phage-related protein
LAQFTALTFDFANNSSINYDVYIVSYGGASGWNTESAESNIQIVSDSIPRRTGNFVYGTRQNDVQQFSITIGSDNKKSRAEIDRIKSWLINMTPQNLIINQPDMDFYRYTGFFTNPQLVSSGNRQFGMTFTFVSTSPFAHTFPKEKTLNITAPTNYVFNNDSGNMDYLRPIIEITPTNITQNFSITNNSDNGRVFQFNFVSPFPNGSEIITVDNQNQIITSSLGNDFSRRRFTQFNMNFLRFIRGANHLRITGNGNLKIRYVFARRIGS